MKIQQKIVVQYTISLKMIKQFYEHIYILRINNDYMIYLPDSPVSQFSSFSDQDNDSHPERRLESVTFSEFSHKNSPTFQPLNQNICIVNKLTLKQQKNYQKNAIVSQNASENNYEANIAAKKDQTDLLKLRISQLNKQLTKEIQQNSLLRQINKKLHQKLEDSLKESQILKKQAKNDQQQRKLFLQEQALKLRKEDDHKRKKIQSLMHELNKMKETVCILKQQTKNYRVRNQVLEKQKRELIYCNENQKCEKEWEENFIKMFVEMCVKLCPEIEEDWSMKKKTQIGWKIIKNIVQRSIEKGLRPPRIQRD